MKDKFATSALYYSEKQAELIRQQGGEIGVIMIEGAPTLWTETKTPAHDGGYRMTRGHSDEDDLKSNWVDAVYLGSMKEGTILVNGRNELTDNGRAYCEKNGLRANVDSLRLVALRPQ